MVKHLLQEHREWSSDSQHLFRETVESVGKHTPWGTVAGGEDGGPKWIPGGFLQPV